MRLFSALLLLATSPVALHTQTRQPVSLHLSGYSTRFVAESGRESSLGVGGEGQLRFTISRFSIGLGAQWTQHSSGQVQLGAALIEPRWTLPVPSDIMAPYVAVRGAVGQQLNAPDRVSLQFFDVGGGAGLLIRLNRRVNLDAGGAVVRSLYRVSSAANGPGLVSDYSANNFAAKIGLSVGLGR
jgi:hypothetical protein